jgi:hypothetical protein
MSGDVADAADYLKFATARVLVCQNQFQALHANGSAAAKAALVLLRHVHTELSEAVGCFCPEGLGVEAWSASYGDGRPVISAMPIDGGGPAIYVHVWHPDRTHPMNNRCELDVITTAEGRKQMLVTAPGVIDAVSLPEIASAGDGQPVSARTASKED